MLARMLLAPGRFGRQQPRRDLIFESEQFATSMQVAVAAGHESRVRLLLESAERASTEVGDAPISECCPKPKVNRRPSWSGQEDENNKMIQVHKPEDDYDIEALLLIAISHDQKSVFDLLLEKTIYIDSHSNNQGSILQHAVRRGSLYFVTKLLECGADVNLSAGDLNPDSSFKLATLAMSVHCQDIKIFESLYQAGAFVEESYGTSVPQLLGLLKESVCKKPENLAWLDDELRMQDRVKVNVAERVDDSTPTSKN